MVAAELGEPPEEPARLRVGILEPAEPLAFHRLSAKIRVGCVVFPCGMVLQIATLWDTIHAWLRNRA